MTSFPDPLFCLLDRSWRPPSPKKNALERLLAAPRGIPREVSAILGAKMLPKERPRGSKIEVRKRSKLKMAKPLKSLTVARILMIFEVLGSLFGAESGSQMGSESHLRRGSPQKASWNPLGTLLGTLGAEKTKCGAQTDGPRPPQTGPDLRHPGKTRFVPGRGPPRAI